MTTLRQRVFALSTVVALTVGIAAVSASSAFAVDTCDQPGYPACPSPRTTQTPTPTASPVDGGGTGGTGGGNTVQVAQNFGPFTGGTGGTGFTGGDGGGFQGAVPDPNYRGAAPAAGLPLGTALNPNGTLRSPLATQISQLFNDSTVSGGNFPNTDAALGAPIGGFAPGSDLIMYVTGPRTTAFFTVSANTSIEDLVREIEAAFTGEGADVQTLTASVLGAVPSVIPSGAPTDDALKAFERSGLEVPITLRDFIGANYTGRWAQVTSHVTHLVPGTVVYYTLTSEPVIIGAAVADKDGNADVSGFLPVDAIPVGDHRVRVVATHPIEGEKANGSGELQITDRATQYVKEFDKGRKATVFVSGEAAHGGKLNVFREIPLGDEAPGVPAWLIWTGVSLLLVLVLATLFFLLRRRRKSREASESTVATV
jgi:hypothetical protein